MGSRSARGRQARVAGLALLARPLVVTVVVAPPVLARLLDAAEDLAFGRTHVRGLVPVLRREIRYRIQETRVALAVRIRPRARAVTHVGVAAREDDLLAGVLRRRGIGLAMEAGPVAEADAQGALVRPRAEK